MENNIIHQKLEALGLTRDEIKIFLSLVSAPRTPLELSRETGIARSNVYRIVDVLAEKGLVGQLTTSNDKLISAASIENLELLVVDQEAKASQFRSNFLDLNSLLASFKSKDEGFEVKTFSGIGGLKQMLWNELHATSEVLLFSGKTLNAPLGKVWAEKFRNEVVMRKIHLRSIENIGVNPFELSDDPGYTKFYRAKYISKEVLNIQAELSIYDNTIAIYNSFGHGLHLGTEVKNPFLAAFMRQVFENYWHLAKTDNVL
ncbi:MAG TPA: helix-turn-helix domain-containing protein [Candidatus Saccharimonadales bacterium]|nr:helix-turn-helix domain-containing protein [Candidatus Saccharimonadales bacterium]